MPRLGVMVGTLHSASEAGAGCIYFGSYCDPEALRLDRAWGLAGCDQCSVRELAIEHRNAGGKQHENRH